MPYVDDPQLGVQGVLEDAVDVRSGQAEGHVDPGSPQRSHDEPTTGCGCHSMVRLSGRTQGFDKGRWDKAAARAARTAVWVGPWGTAMAVFVGRPMP
ncbi:hypothetical protein GCM10010251_75160 [Streptomyces aurantiogriseus]|uniref:Uncharacterized protein n=1 Tax=Streptomyces aurantiogriseus TaxID=66870 RepID=A0A918FKK7_9ACTN|nr:hypothetical protein GCM10010251_75160 [Streptomyces aurantiogriseus]